MPLQYVCKRSANSVMKPLTGGEFGVKHDISTATEQCKSDLHVCGSADIPNQYCLFWRQVYNINVILKRRYLVDYELPSIPPRL